MSSPSRSYFIVIINNDKNNIMKSIYESMPSHQFIFIKPACWVYEILICINTDAASCLHKFLGYSAESYPNTENVTNLRNIILKKIM